MSALAGLFAAVGLNRRPVRALAVVAGVVLLGLAGFAPGCKKESESLILVSMQVGRGEGDGRGVTAVEIRVNEPSPSTGLVISKVYDLPTTGLPVDTTFEVGIYIPAGVTGTLPVTAIARPAQGCAGYMGSRSAKVDGGDTTPILLSMQARDVCTLAGTAGAGGTTGVGGAAGGTAGGAGTTGAGGRGGTTGTGGSVVVGTCGDAPGTPPAAVAPPSLTNCTEVDHNPVGAVCDPSIDDFNPYINNVAVSPDGQLLATAGSDALADGAVKIWRFQGATPVPCGPVISGPTIGPPFVAFSPNGQFLAVAWNGAYVEIYSVPTFAFVAEAKSSPNPLFGVGWSPDSQTVFSIDWDFGSNGTLYADRPDGTALSSVRLNVDPDALAVSPVASGGVTTIAVAGYDGNAGVYTWNGSSLAGPTIVTTAPASHGWGIRFSPNGQLLAIGGSDGQVRFFGIPATSTTPVGTSINVGSNNTVYGIAFSPGSDFVGLAFGMQAEIWNVSTRMFVSRRTLVPPPGATSTYADSVTFSASGGALIVGEDVCGKVLVCSD